MGVDTSISVGVGFVIEPNAFTRYRETVDAEGNYGDDELLELLLSKNADGLSYGMGGSYYSNEPIVPWIAIGRLTSSFDASEIPGGVVGLSKPTITLAEREALDRVASTLGQAEITVGQFMSVLWH